MTKLLSYAAFLGLCGSVCAAQAGDSYDALVLVDARYSGSNFGGVAASASIAPGASDDEPSFGEVFLDGQVYRDQRSAKQGVIHAALAFCGGYDIDGDGREDLIINSIRVVDSKASAVKLFAMPLQVHC